MKQYGREESAEGTYLSVNTNHILIVGIGLRVPGNFEIVFLTVPEVAALMEQLSVWLVDNTKGGS